MDKRRSVPGFAVPALLLGAPKLAFAGGASVIVDLAAVNAEFVPTMSHNLVIAMALLLAVIGFRFLRQRDARQKLLSVLLLGGGVLLGGFGVERSLAITAPTVPPDDPACAGGTTSLDTLSGPFIGVVIFNGCTSTALRVEGYRNMPCLPGEQIVKDAGIGAIIPPGGSATTNYCPGDS